MQDNNWESRTKFLEFWKDKELEYNSKLLMQSFAIYRSDNINISGLLYLMEDGFHFEDFPKKNLLLNFFKSNKKFNKTKKFISKGNITKLNDGKNQTPIKKSKNLLEKIISPFIKYERIIIIYYIDLKGNHKNVVFETLINAYEWREKLLKISK